MLESTAQAWEQFGAKFLTIRPGTSVVEGDELGDPAGQLWDVMRAHGVNFLVVRPDRYVYAATEYGHQIATPMFASVERSGSASVRKLDQPAGRSGGRECAR
jgi:3-(3-hydroxy-phenyl)propionate hydroxylase